MRTSLSCLMMLVGCALAGRLENTYLPPPGAAQAGGVNLAAPFRAATPQNTYLPPTAIRTGNSGSSSFNSGSSGFSTGGGSSSFNSGSSSTFSSGALGSSFGAAGRFGVQQQQQQQQLPQAAQAAKLSSYSSSGSNSFQAPTPRPALIIKQVNENPGDGTYTFSYETENGIQAEERGQVRADGAEGLAAVQGAYAFTAPDDNTRYTVTYTADENGFLAYGDHLPTPPPVPAEILRALEQNAADEARGLLDDGQYRSEHHGQEQPLQQGGFLRLRGGISNSGSSSSGSGASGSGVSGSSGSGSSNGGYHY